MLSGVGLAFQANSYKRMIFFPVIYKRYCLLVALFANNCLCHFLLQHPVMAYLSHLFLDSRACKAILYRRPLINTQRMNEGMLWCLKHGNLAANRQWPMKGVLHRQTFAIAFSFLGKKMIWDPMFLAKRSQRRAWISVWDTILTCSPKIWS